MNGNIKDISGQKFGRLTAIEVCGSDDSAVWLCRCDCGNYHKARGTKLRAGWTKSCGCLSKDPNTHKTHGLHRHRLYSIWRSMRDRCKNNRNDNFRHYGGRGISVCKEWDKKFMPFYNWAIFNGYSDELSLDRINNNGKYEPDNCHWATQKEQCRNSRRNVKVEIDGKTYGTMVEAAEEYGVPYKRFEGRYRNGKRGKDLIAPKISRI